MSSGLKMAGAAAVGVAGGLAIGSMIEHENDQSERIERLEQEQRENQSKYIQVCFKKIVDLMNKNRLW
jgi:hypothetical protein